MRHFALLMALGLLTELASPARAADDVPSELLGDVAAIQAANRWGEDTNRIYEVYDRHRADLELAFAWAHNEIASLNLAEALDPKKLLSDEWITEKMRQIGLTREALQANEAVLAVKFSSLRQDIDNVSTPEALPASHHRFFQDMLRLTEEAYAADVDVDRRLMTRFEAMLSVALGARRSMAAGGKQLRFADSALQARWDGEWKRTMTYVRALPQTQAALFSDVD